MTRIRIHTLTPQLELKSDTQVQFGRFNHIVIIPFCKLITICPEMVSFLEPPQLIQRISLHGVTANLSIMVLLLLGFFHIFIVKFSEKYIGERHFRSLLGVGQILQPFWYKPYPATMVSNGLKNHT